MKLLISALVVIGFQVSLAAGKAGSTHSESEGHKDWNEVFKQPEQNPGKSTLPAKTQLIEPAFLAQIPGTEVTLKWNAVEGDLIRYHLQVATDPNYKWLVVNQHLATFTEYTLKDLKKGQQYFWRVYTYKTDNMAAYSKSAAISSAFVTAE